MLMGQRDGTPEYLQAHLHTHVSRKFLQAQVIPRYLTAACLHFFILVVNVAVDLSVIVVVDTFACIANTTKSEQARIVEGLGNIRNQQILKDLSNGSRNGQKLSLRGDSVSLCKSCSASAEGHVLVFTRS